MFAAFFRTNTLGSSLFHRIASGYIRSGCEGADDPEALAKALTPTGFEVGCKRMTPSDDYVKTFTRDHVHLVESGVSDLYSDGVVTADGTRVGLDVLVLATGFDLEASVRPYEVYT